MLRLMVCHRTDFECPLRERGKPLLSYVLSIHVLWLSHARTIASCLHTFFPRSDSSRHVAFGIIGASLSSCPHVLSPLVSVAHRLSSRRVVFRIFHTFHLFVFENVFRKLGVDFIVLLPYNRRCDWLNPSQKTF